MANLKTRAQKRSEYKALKIYVEYEELASDPRNKKSEITALLARKFDVCETTVWRLRKVGARLMNDFKL